MPRCLSLRATEQGWGFCAHPRTLALAALLGHTVARGCLEDILPTAEAVTAVLLWPTHSEAEAPQEAPGQKPRWEVCGEKQAREGGDQGGDWEAVAGEVR